MSELPETVSVDEQARPAGRVRIDMGDPVTALHEQCKQFIENANMSSHARMMALPKLDEMVFWIRAGQGKG